MTVFTPELEEGGKGGKAGEGGVFEITNAEFIAAAFHNLPDAAFAAVCTKSGDPGIGGWSAQRADKGIERLSVDYNNYINCSSFYAGEHDSLKARKNQFAAYHFLMLDDLGTKVPLERLADIDLSWLIETSPGNHQGGIILADPITDGDVAVRLLDAIIAAGLCDSGASGPSTRWSRLPVAINGKPKHASVAGVPFRCRLIEWRPEMRYTPGEIVALLGLELAPAERPKREAKPSTATVRGMRDDTDDVLTPKAAENPVVNALKERGLYKTPLGSGKHDIICPWVHEHTDGLDTGTAYFEPDEFHPLGGFCCKHSHGDKFHILKLLEFLGIQSAEARHKSVIRIIPGDMALVVDAAEKELADRGGHYQSGGLIVSISTDPTSGDPSIVPVTLSALTKELSVAATWEKYDGRTKDWIRSDPPSKHVSILHDAQSFRHLLPLAGVVRQPYFRELDGLLVTQPGYDKTSKLFGVFDHRKFEMPAQTFEAALEAMAMLEELLTEFHFVKETDKAAALSAIFTAVVRQTLPYAPGFHVRAPAIGSGKSYLCDLIATFAGPGESAKVSYPSSSEEATKTILSLLLKNPAVINFDDMGTDWVPHGIINRMLTAEYITDRILGVSKTATVSTRTLFLGSGNNVGPVRDLLRRVLTIHVDARCATPATLTYKNYPVEKVRRQRGLYVAAVLTIISAWRKADSPHADVENIVSFGGTWSDYCRHPIIWLGYPDPATALLEQVKQDPDGDSLAGLMREWRRSFDSTFITVRKAVTVAKSSSQDLLDAMREFPIEEKGEINPSKLGRILKRYENRIIDGYEFQSGTADGRKAWGVIAAEPFLITRLPPLPPLPPSTRPTEITVTAATEMLTEMEM
jgi:hypothetical protein